MQANEIIRSEAERCEPVAIRLLVWTVRRWRIRSWLSKLVTKKNYEIDNSCWKSKRRGENRKENYTGPRSYCSITSGIVVTLKKVATSPNLHEKVLNGSYLANIYNIKISDQWHRSIKYGNLRMSMSMSNTKFLFITSFFRRPA